MSSVVFWVATISLIVTVGLTIHISLSNDIVEKGYCACYTILGWIWMLLIAIVI